MCKTGPKPAPSYTDLEQRLAASESARREAEKAADAWRTHAKIAESHSDKWLVDLASERAARERLQERLDQFEAYAITVASALDERAARERAERLLAECDDELENASCPPMTNETIPERIARLAGLVSSTVRDEQTALEGKGTAESRLAAAESALRHAARELQYIADDERCDKLHQSEEGLACIALAESLLGPMRDWPEEPNASARSYLAGGRP